MFPYFCITADDYVCRSKKRLTGAKTGGNLFQLSVQNGAKPGENIFIIVLTIRLNMPVKDSFKSSSFSTFSSFALPCSIYDAVGFYEHILEHIPLPRILLQYFTVK